MTIDYCKTLLKEYWGYDGFRGIQEDIIKSILSGHDTLGLMPTGGGKSITFQVPALAMEGVCIVITPLIALMKDQVHHLRQVGIMASAIYTGMQKDDILRVLENCILGHTKLLYVSPERLGSQLFKVKLSHMKVSFITVDEAHCISQWGYDFRPSYLEISKIRELHPEVPVLALTATATPEVVDDIQDKLSLKAPNGRNLADEAFNVFRMSFARSNLAYIVCKTENKFYELVSQLSDCNASSIVYVRSRRHAREISHYLEEAGLSSTFYHAGLEAADKDRRQRDWQSGRTTIMVATNAFGMGIDKSNVRLVMHYDCPDSLEAYFQEAGRAGRDGQPARAVLLFNNSDRAKLLKRIGETFPEKDYVRDVYEDIAFYFQIATGDGYGVCRDFSLDDFCRKFGHFPVRVHSALQILQRAGYLEYSDETDNQARLRFLVNRESLYRLESVTPDEDRVIIALLRNYGGLFADYEFIDESLVASESGLQADYVHETLKALSRRGLVSFIPRRQAPQIRYLQRREDKQNVRLSKEVYDDRLEQYEKRIKAFVKYAQSDDTCRQKLLLEYFGEKVGKPCGQCDVCVRNNTEHDGKTVEDVERQIIAILANGDYHDVTELLKIHVPDWQLDKALEHLFCEEYVVREDCKIRLVATP